MGLSETTYWTGLRVEYTWHMETEESGYADEITVYTDDDVDITDYLNDAAFDSIKGQIIRTRWDK